MQMHEPARTRVVETTAFRTVLYSFILTIIFVVCARIGNWRDGSSVSPLTWDSSYYFGNAIRIKQSMEERGIAGLAHSWINVSKTHAPLVPTLSAFLMLLFGESREVALLVLPLFTFLLILSVARCVQLLYPARGTLDTMAPFAAAFLTCCYPVFIHCSRIYLFEFPLAALTAAACWALLTTNYFTKTRPAIVFGVVAGLATVARAGGPALLTGPAAVYALISMRQGLRALKIRNLATGVVISLAIAASWYLPNWKYIVEYIYSVTYGNRAGVFTVSGSSLSLMGAWWLFWGSIVDGPGLPALLFGIFTYLATSLSRRTFLISRTAVALGAAFLIDFILVVPASQKPGGLLLLAILPASAILLVRAAVSTRRRILAAAALFFTLLFGVHHLYSLTWGFRRGMPANEGFGPFSNIQIWNHRNAYCDLVGDSAGDPRWQTWLTEISDRIASTNISKGDYVHLLVDHAYLQANNLTLEGLKRNRNWLATSLPLISEESQKADRLAIRKVLIYSKALVIHTPGNSPPTPFDKMVDFIIKPLLDGPGRRFRQLGNPIPYIDGQSLIVYERIPDLEWSPVPPAYVNLTKTATFHAPEDKNKTGPAIRLAGWGYAHVDGMRWTELVFEVPVNLTTIPRFGVQVMELSRSLISTPQIEYKDSLASRRSPDDRFLIVRVTTDGLMPAKLHERGFLLGAFVGEIEHSRRYVCDSALPVLPGENCVLIATIPADAGDTDRGPDAPLDPPPDIR